MSSAIERGAGFRQPLSSERMKNDLALMLAELALFRKRAGGTKMRDDVLPAAGMRGLAGAGHFDLRCF